MGTRVKKDRREAARSALKIIRDRNAKNERTNTENRAVVKAATDTLNQKGARDLKNSTAEKRDRVDSNKPKGVDSALEAKAMKGANQARVGQKVKPVGRAALGVGGLAAVAGLAQGMKKDGDSARETYTRTGVLYNGGSAEQADTIAKSQRMLREQKEGKKTPAPKPKKPTARPGSLAASTVPAERKAPTAGEQKPKASEKKAAAPTVNKPVVKKEVAKKAVEAGKTPSSTGSRKDTVKGYPVYKKDSAEAKDFRSAFAAARKAGKSEFTWQGRKYNTKIKK